MIMHSMPVEKEAAKVGSRKRRRRSILVLSQLPMWLGALLDPVTVSVNHKSKGMNQKRKIVFLMIVPF